MVRGEPGSGLSGSSGGDKLSPGRVGGDNYDPHSNAEGISNSNPIAYSDRDPHPFSFTNPNAQSNNA